MAIRSGGGTGVLVALVVFVVTTVFCLVFMIVFYAGKNETATKLAEAQAELKTFINTAQQQDDAVKQLKAAASNEGQSLYGFLMNRTGAITDLVGSPRTADAKSIQGELGLRDGETAKTALTDLRRQLRAKTDEVASLNNRITELTKQATALREEVDVAKRDGQKLAEAVRSEFAGYDSAGRELVSQTEDARREMIRTIEELKSKHANAVGELQSEIDQLRASTAIIQSRNDVLVKKLEAMELKPQNAAELVDGRVIAIEGTDDQVFIDIGKRDRVVPGMTFEVFDDANAIAASDKTGRGKASIQILRVADSTSTAKIIRQSTGRPVVKDDVIANAVFNPDYQFKFLVHGKFDVDGDGRPSDSEAQYLRSRILEWGGEIIDGDTLVGDLDFLVLGMQPPMPPPLPQDATDAQLQASIEARNARETYDRLFKEAIDARIPVLNWNRFQVLTGTVVGR
jgi:hypothetical protein